MTTNHCYSVRLDEAVALAVSSFRAVRRKGTDIPYLTHLTQVMTWVGEHGGDEEQMIAAVLHDYLEDIPGATREDLERRFGVRVGRLVAELSDKPSAADSTSWSDRKVAYLAHLPIKPPEVKLISVADKLHNARCIHRDFRTLGSPLWERFNGGQAGTLWYYRGLVRALSTQWSHPLVDELAAEVAALHAAAGVVYAGDHPAVEVTIGDAQVVGTITYAMGATLRARAEVPILGPELSRHIAYAVTPPHGAFVVGDALTEMGLRAARELVAESYRRAVTSEEVT